MPNTKGKNVQSLKKTTKENSVPIKQELSYDIDLKTISQEDYDEVFSRFNDEFHKLSTELIEAKTHFVDVQARHEKTRNILVSLQALNKERNKQNNR